MSEAGFNLYGGLSAAVRRAPYWFAAGTLVGLVLCALFLKNSSEVKTSEIVANIQIGQYWPKIGISQPLEHPKRAIEALKQTVLDRKESQTHIQSYSYTTSSDPWGLVISVNSKDSTTTRAALDEAIRVLVEKQNASFDRISKMFEKKLNSLEIEQAAIAEAVRESLSDAANTKSTALSSMIAKSIITDNELAQIETGLLADPAHFMRTQYSVAEYPKTLSRLRVILMFGIGLCVSIGVGLIASGIGAELRNRKQL